MKIDGSLNRRVLDRLLGAILSQILLKPGCSIYQVAERFHPALQPYQCRELVEVHNTNPFLKQSASFTVLNREKIRIYLLQYNFIVGFLIRFWKLFFSQILEKLGCVELYGALRTGKAGPFSSRPTVEIGIYANLYNSTVFFSNK